MEAREDAPGLAVRRAMNQTAMLHETPRLRYRECRVQILAMAVAVAHAWAAATLRALQPRQSAELVCQRLRSKLVAVRVVQRRRSARGGDARLLRRRGQGETQGLG